MNQNVKLARKVQQATSKVLGKNSVSLGCAPAIVLINPKHARNVGMIVRLASCYGIQQVWYTGNRVRLDAEAGYRLPREERMKGYGEVSLFQFDKPFDQLEGAVPVAVEVRENAERLPEFVHPENAVYVFGPEDGSLERVTTNHCHRFVIIPSNHCLNLATAVATVLYDRACKRWDKEQLVLKEERGLSDFEGYEE